MGERFNQQIDTEAGKLAEVAALRGQPPEETAMDLVIEDDSRVQSVFFSMSEDNIRRQVALPWVSFGSDAEASAPEGDFLKSATHPRAYGDEFARGGMPAGGNVANGDGGSVGSRHPVQFRARVRSGPGRAEIVGAHDAQARVIVRHTQMLL